MTILALIPRWLQKCLTDCVLEFRTHLWNWWRTETKLGTINDSTSPSTVSLQILRGKNELEELTVDPEHPARVAIETLREHLQTIGRLKQK